MDDLRFRSQQTPRNDMNMSNFSRNGAGRAPQPTNPQDRSNLTRRFTTDSGRVPTLSNMVTSPQGGADGSQEFHVGLPGVIWQPPIARRWAIGHRLCSFD